MLQRLKESLNVIAMISGYTNSLCTKHFSHLVEIWRMTELMPSAVVGFYYRQSTCPQAAQHHYSECCVVYLCTMEGRNAMMIYIYPKILLCAYPW